MIEKCLFMLLFAFNCHSLFAAEAESTQDLYKRLNAQAENQEFEKGVQKLQEKFEANQRSYHQKLDQVFVNLTKSYGFTTAAGEIVSSSIIRKVEQGSDLGEPVQQLHIYFQTSKKLVCAASEELSHDIDRTGLSYQSTYLILKCFAPDSGLAVIQLSEEIQ
jgi:hypothetical protein